MNSYDKYKTPFRTIRRFIRVANVYGYRIEVLGKSISGTYYVDFINKSTEKIDFVLRFSDHFLNKENYLPAGVVFERSSLETCIRDIQQITSLLRKISKKERKELWTNRLVP